MSRQYKYPSKTSRVVGRSDSSKLRLNPVQEAEEEEVCEVSVEGLKGLDRTYNGDFQSHPDTDYTLTIFNFDTESV